ncbi:MAG: MarR family winged helix-turn-helix transcriptional regulator [Culicoidibacterales bacterium]
METKQLLRYLFVDLVDQMSIVEENQLRKRGILDLTIREVHVIEAIGKNEHQQMSEVAQRLQISMGTLTVVIKRLIDKNYVVRRRDLHDRRIFRLDLTPAGIEVDTIHQQFHTEMIDELARDFAGDDQHYIHDFLQELVNYFEAYRETRRVVKYE